MTLYPDIVVYMCSKYVPNYMVLFYKAQFIYIADVLYEITNMQSIHQRRDHINCHSGNVIMGSLLCF